MERSFFLKTLGAIGAAGWMASATARTRQPVSPTAQDPDWKRIRDYFSYPRDYYYFNTAGIGAVPVFVRELTAAHWEETEVYPKPGHNQEDWKAVKSELARLAGVQDSAQVALTNSATEGINIILNGMDWEAGDEIITSSHEHPALHVPLIQLARRRGVVVRSFQPDMVSSGENVSRIRQLVNSRTRLIFMSMVTCTTGQLFPIDEIISLAHKQGVAVALDGAQATGQVPLKLSESNVDFYTTGGQKWLLGPKRTGFLYLHPQWTDRLRPTTVGAYSEQAYNLDDMSLSWADGASRFEYATQNESLFAGLKASAAFMNRLEVDEIAAHNRRMAESFVELVLSMPSFRLCSPKEANCRTSIISISHEHKNFRQLADEFMKRRCRVRVVFEGGMEAVRFSFHLYNGESDLEYLAAVMREIA